MDKIDQVVGFLVELRDSIEDLLDELVPPLVDERVEAELSEAPPQRGVALPEGRRRGRTSIRQIQEAKSSSR